MATSAERPASPEASTASASGDKEQRLASHLARAGELLRGENMDGADREVAEALKLAPDDVRARNLLGLVRFRAGRYDEAHAVYRELVGKDGGDTALRLNLGLVELRMGRHADASVNLKKVVEQEPNNTKAQGYYGLSLMRSGDLANARKAFLLAGQGDLVKQVDEQLAARTGAKPGTPVAVKGLDVELIAPESAAPAPAPRKDAVDLTSPLPLAAFIGLRELRPGGPGEPFSVAGELLVVRVEGRLPIRTAGAVASSGRLAYAPVTRRMRGKAGEEPFGDGEDQLVIASGSGTIVVSPRGGKFTPLLLHDKDVLYLRESVVFAFEEGLYWENGKVPGGGAGGMVVVQFRGEGRVVLRSKKSPYTLKLGGGDVLYVDQDGLLGWIGNVVPQQLRGVDGEPTQYIACSGEGALLLEDPMPNATPIPA